MIVPNMVDQFAVCLGCNHQGQFHVAIKVGDELRPDGACTVKRCRCRRWKERGNYYSDH